MSETSILPGAVPAPADSDNDAPPPVVDGEEKDGNGANRRILLIAGAVAGVIILLAAAYMLLHKSSSTPTISTPVAGAAVVSGNTAPSGGTKVVKGTVKVHTRLPKQQARPIVRDPFKPLVIPPVAVTQNPNPTTTVPAQSPPQPSSGATVPTTTTSTAPPVITGIGAPQTVRLIKTTAGYAVLNVGYAHGIFRTFQVATPPVFSDTGTVFDKIFSLISVESGSVTLQVGDATPFDLEKGTVHTV